MSDLTKLVGTGPYRTLGRAELEQGRELLERCGYTVTDKGSDFLYGNTGSLVSLLPDSWEPRFRMLVEQTSHFHGREDLANCLFNLLSVAS